MERNINSIIHGIARQEGVTEQAVIDEMQKAIGAGYANPDPAVQARWAAMPFKGKPAPQELILYLAEAIKK